jgi:hypothetical protein
MLTGLQRVARMRRAFAKNKSIFAVDYEYFTTPHASIHPNIAARKSAERSGRRSPKRNETPSSDKNGD